MTRRPVTLTLVEVPAVNLHMGGESVLDDFTLNHPKYPQMVLAANLRQITDVDVVVHFVDLKAGGERTVVPYGSVNYGGERLDISRVGVPFDHAREQLLGTDVVAIPANFTCERALVAQTIDYLRRHGTSPLIVVGGHDATADPEYYLRRGASLCVLGEGETALQEIVRAVARGEPPAVSGTAWLQHGRLRREPKRPVHSFDEIVFPDADTLRAFRFDQSPDGPLPPGVSPPLVSFETSRGCPEACSFCDISFIVGRFRAVTFQRLADQVRAFKAAGISTIQMIDDNLLYRTLPAYEREAGRQTILDLFQLLYDEGFAWEFFNGFQLGLFEHAGAIDGPLMDALFRNDWNGSKFVGCFRSYIPIDKVTAGEMSRLRKLKPLNVARAVVSAIAERGVPTLILGFVIGSVRETVATLDETMTRADEFRATVVRSSRGQTRPIVLPLCSVPLPGTPDFREFNANIRYPADRYPELYNVFTSVLETDAFTPLELTRQRQRMRDALNVAPDDGGGSAAAVYA